MKLNLNTAIGVHTNHNISLNIHNTLGLSCARGVGGWGGWGWLGVAGGGWGWPVDGLSKNNSAFPAKLELGLRLSLVFTFNIVLLLFLGFHISRAHISYKYSRYKYLFKIKKKCRSTEKTVSKNMQFVKSYDQNKFVTKIMAIFVASF